MTSILGEIPRPSVVMLCSQENLAVAEPVVAELGLKGDSFPRISDAIAHLSKLAIGDVHSLVLEPGGFLYREGDSLPSQLLHYVSSNGIPLGLIGDSASIAVGYYRRRFTQPEDPTSVVIPRPVKPATFGAWLTLVNEMRQSQA